MVAHVFRLGGAMIHARIRIVIRQLSSCPPPLKRWATLSNPNARLALAKALLAHNELDGARTEFEAALKQAPNQVEAMNGLGLAYLRQGRTSQAIIQFDEALRIKPDFADAAENLRIARATDSRFRSRLTP